MGVWNILMALLQDGHFCLSLGTGGGVGSDDVGWSD